MEVVRRPKVITVWQGKIVVCRVCECELRINEVEVGTSDAIRIRREKDRRLVLRCPECKTFIAFAKFVKLPGSA